LALLFARLLMATVTYQNQVVTVADLSCATVRPALTTAMNWSGYTATSCSATPVIAGTAVTFTNQYGTPYTQSITAVSGASTSTGTGTTSCPVDTPFDYTYASGIWALAFTSVITLYVVSLHIGTVLNLIRGR
jgi:hypothetical protein